MDRIDFSVIIRTTGNAKEKYQLLLNSIDQLDPPPKEIIVVLPEGTVLPTERIGKESFFFSPKGMVIQRLVGIEKCKTKYALLCDDDVCFGSDFVQKLHEPVGSGSASFSSGPLYSFLPQKGIRAFVDCVTSRAAPSIFHKNRYVSVLRTSGYSYNRHLNTSTPYYEAQSLPWTCFFMNVEDFKKIGFEEEIWLDAHGYSAMDDQTMFYKAWLRGLKTVVVTDAEYQHLDAKTSIMNNKPAVIYSLRFNRVVFWHRFIYQQQKRSVGRIWSRIAFGYRLVWEYVFDTLAYLRGRWSKDDLNLSRKAWQDGKKYICSPEYTALPEV